MPTRPDGSEAYKIVVANSVPVAIMDGRVVFLDVPVRQAVDI